MLKNEAKSWEKRAVIALLRQSVGRGGEVSTITWDSEYWDPQEEVFTLDWSEEKMAKENEVTYVPDYDNWILDSFHTTTSYLVTYSGESTKYTEIHISWTFPCMHGFKWRILSLCN